MARTLPIGLAAKIAATGQQPEISITAQDLVQRLAVYAQGGTAGRSSALLSSTTKIIRAVCQQAAATNQTITCQTITPATPASWTAAPVTITTNAVARAGCSLVQTGATTRCFYQRTADNIICFRDSTNDGLTWGAEQVTVATVPTAMLFCYGIAADSTTSLHTQWATFDPNGVCAFFRTSFSGSWSAWANVGPGTPAYGVLRGAAVTNVAGTRRFAIGAGLRGYTSGISAAWFTWNGISTYSGMTAIQQLDTPSQGLALSYPDLFFDPSNLFGDGLQWYATVLLTDDGSVSTSAHTRTTVYRSSDGATWQPWLQTGTAFQYGAHVIVTSGAAYLFDATTTYILQATPAAIDLTNDLLSLTIHEQYNQPAQADLILSNNTGQYNAASFLKDNATITVALGYGGQTVTTHTLYVDDWSLTANGEELTLAITCRDGAKLLDYPSTLLLVYQNQTLSQILTALFKQPGVTLAALPTTPQFSQTVSCFVLTPGETWLSGLNRLSTLYGFTWRADATPRVIISEPAASDPSTWTYAAEALATEYGQQSNRPNVVRVTGATTGTTTAFSEATDPTNILLTGDERFLLMVDRMLDTSAKCQIRAALTLRSVQREATHGTIIAPLNPQHELTDVITYSDTPTNNAPTTARISAQTLTASPREALWEHRLLLEAP